MKIWIRNYQEILWFLCGNYGILCFLENLTGITCRKSIISLWITVFICGLWYFYFFRKKWLITAAAFTAAMTLVLIFTQVNTLLLQANHLRSAFLGAAGLAQQDITLLFLVVMTVIASILFAVEFIWKQHSISSLLMITMLLLGPLLGIPSGYKAVFFLALFLIPPFMSGMKKAAGITAVLVFAATFLMVFPNQEHFYNAAYRTEHFFHNTISWLTGMADEATADGRISRGNNYKTGTVQLEVETYALPSETLYLRGFSGNQYTGGNWQRSSETELLEMTLQTLGWHQRAYNISSMYSGMYYTLNSFLSGNGIRDSRSINIKHVSRHYGSYFEPYGGQWLNGTLYSTASTYEGYDYRYYQQSDMHIDWDKTPAAFSSQAEWYRNLQDAYMKVVREACLDIPQEKLPRLTELCKAHPLTDFDEITAFIIATLESRASYTQMPGNAPMNKDIVEYFLFESGKGYCQHFAATATLMYRLYGIPARYASGYVVYPADFQLESGIYKAYITDESAHAWTEVFLKDFGWVPIEVTPTADGSIQPSYPGFDGTEWEQMLENYHWDLDINMPTPAEEEDTQASNPVWEMSSIAWEDYQKTIWVFVTILLYTIVLLPFFLNYRRLRYLERFHAKDCCAHFHRLIRMLHDAGYLNDCDGTEAEFAERLAELFPTVHKEEIENVITIVEKKAYGRPECVSELEEVFVKELYRRLSEQVYDGLKRHQKWMFRYGKWFC